MSHGTYIGNRFDAPDRLTDMRQVPIGILDFGKIRDLDLYFVDKTPLIDDILSRRGGPRCSFSPDPGGSASPRTSA